MLWVYELRGDHPPQHLPEDGLVGVWPEPPFYYAFYKCEALASIEEWLRSNPGWESGSQYSIPYEKWQDISVSHLEIGPFKIELTGGASSRGAGDVVDREQEKISLRIDPGIVFGSGLHATTQGCLLALAELFNLGSIHTAMDFGTGTGILAIACAALGARSILAIDAVPLALRVASKNAALNGLSDRIGFLAADRLGVVDVRPDLLLMNVEWPSMEKILHGDEWRRARDVVLAGFLPGRTEQIGELALPGFKVVRTFSHQGWPILILSR
jgi:ribosomal protein L11 methyltransferase